MMVKKFINCEYSHIFYCKYFYPTVNSIFRPLTLSENLTKQAHKIDWTKGDAEDDDEDIPSMASTAEKDAEEDSKKPDFQASNWPWDSVRNKLRSALTEVCVLADVITVSKDKRYMVLDPVQQEQPEQRQLAQLFSKKRVKEQSSF